MFKNLHIFRTEIHPQVTTAELDALLQPVLFQPTSPTQEMSMGFIAPRSGAATGAGDNGQALPLVEGVRSADGHLDMIMRFAVERRTVPASAVKKRVKEIVDHIEQTTGRKPGRKEQKELAEQARHELLPNAFTRESQGWVWFSPRSGMLAVDAGSDTVVDQVLTLLAKNVPDAAFRGVDLQHSLTAKMTDWLQHHEVSDEFHLGRSCELKAMDESGGVVRYKNQLLDCNEVRNQLTVQGLVPHALAMNWADRVSFTLTARSLTIKGIDFTDVVTDERNSQQNDDPFDANATIAVAEMGRLIPELIEALGGEIPLGG